MPHVTCHVSDVMCHMSHVTCNLFDFFSSSVKIMELVGGASVIHGAYPVSFLYQGSLDWVKVSPKPCFTPLAIQLLAFVLVTKFFLIDIANRHHAKLKSVFGSDLCYSRGQI